MEIANKQSWTCWRTFRKPWLKMIWNKWWNLTQEWKKKLSLANNAYAVMPFDKSHLPRDELAEMILPENDPDMKAA